MSRTHRMIWYRQNTLAILLGGILLVLLTTGILQPFLTLLQYSVQDNNGNCCGTDNFQQLLTTPGLLIALKNSIKISILVTLISISLAFVIAYGLTHTLMVGKAWLHTSLQLPLCVPSILPCLGLIYLFGGQGIMTNYIEIHLYGPVGVILGGVIFTLPHAVLLLTTTLRCIDPRLYQAAEMLGATRGGQFISVTLPNTIYGIISTCFVVFTLTLTDFGIAKVLSGQYNLLATEIYQQIVGQNNFAMGSTLSLLLIMPVLMAFWIDSWARKKQARLTSADYPRHLHPVLWRDSLFTLLCWLPAGIIISVIMVVVWGSLITYWPYDFSITLDNYAFSQMGYNWQPYINSLRFAVTVAITGTFGCFITAYIVQRGNLPQWLQSSLRLLALLPLGIPGTVLGLAYLLTFNQPGSWLTLWSGSLSILVINTVIHLFSVAFISFSSTLTQMNRHYEKVGASLGIRSFTTFQRIILPLSQHTLADVFFYLFTNALTTVSAVIFLYGPDSLLASISILTMDDAGDFAAASAMGTVLLLTALTAKTIHFIYLKKFGFPSVRSSL